MAASSFAVAFRCARRVWRTTGAFRVANWVLARTPPWVQAKVARQKLRARLRAGEWLVPEAELQACYEAALDLLARRDPSRTRGDYLEFGVFVGTSLLCMQRALESRLLTDVRLVGFDSFEGLPDAAAHDDGGHWLPGEFASDIATTKRYLTENGVDWSRVQLVPGWFSDTLTPVTREALGLQRAHVIMVDCDIYSSTKTALEFCAPLIYDTVILFDDWHSAGDLAAKGMGEKRAFDEFLAAHPHFIVQQLDAYSATAAVFHVVRRST